MIAHGSICCGVGDYHCASIGITIWELRLHIYRVTEVTLFWIITTARFFAYVRLWGHRFGELLLHVYRVFEINMLDGHSSRPAHLFDLQGRDMVATRAGRAAFRRMGCGRLGSSRGDQVVQHGGEGRN